MKNDKKNIKETKKEPLTKEQATELAAKMTKESAGRYIIAMASAGNTKLSLKDLKKDTKEKAFNTFCVAWDKPAEDGMVLAKVESFRVDKNNNVYMVARPMVSLKNIKSLFASNVWSFIMPYEVMWQPYGAKAAKEADRLNVDAVYEKWGYEKGEDEAASRKQVWEDMAAGKFGFEDLSKTLNSLTQYETYAKKMYKDWKEGRLDELTYLKDRLEREDMSERAMTEFCEKEHAAYVKLGMSGANNIAEEAEAVIKHYKEIKAAEKEARKAAKSK